MGLDSISTLNLKNSYNNFGNMYENMSIKGKHFFYGTEDMYVGSNQGVYFNKRLLKEVAPDVDLYKLVNDNQWTISKLRDLAKKGTQEKDGKPGMSKEDQWGLLCTDYVCAGAEAFFSASGGQMFKNSNGTVTYNMDAPATIDIINQANQFFVKDRTAYALTSNDQELFDMFVSGKGLFLMANATIGSPSAENVAAIAEVSEMEDDFGYVPFPRGDNASGYSAIVNWNRPVMMVPAGLSDAEMKDIGTLLEAYGYLSSSVSKVQYQEYADRYFRDDESADMISISNRSQQFVISSLLGSINFNGVHVGTYKVFYECIPGNQSTKTLVDQTKSSVVTALEDFLAKV